MYWPQRVAQEAPVLFKEQKAISNADYDRKFALHAKEKVTHAEVDPKGASSKQEEIDSGQKYRQMLVS